MAQQINLFNPIFLKQKKYFSALTMLQALALVIIGVLAFYAYAVHETRNQSRIAADSSRQLAQQTRQVAALMQEFSPQGRSKLLQDELTRASARLRQREALLAQLRTGGLGNTAGFARYLAALAHQPVRGVWLTGFSISGDESELQLKGRVLQADLVPVYLRALSREEVMRGRRVTELRLTAREERDAAAAAPGAPPAAPATGVPAAPPASAPAAPNRYVEFSMIAQRTSAGQSGTPAGEKEKATR